MPKTQIKITTGEMSDELQREALQCALLAVNMYDSSLDIATYIKKEFDRKYQPSWQCFVGDFGGLVTHTEDCYIYFSVGNKNIVLFKSA